MGKKEQQAKKAGKPAAVSVIFPEEQISSLRKDADANDRSIAAQVRVAVKFWAENATRQTAI